MKKITCIALLTLSPLAAYAACNVVPLSTDQLTTTVPISGQVVKGEACRGVSSRATYTADQYSFQGTKGDSIRIYNSGSASFVAFFDPEGVQFTNTASSDYFSFSLPTTGIYKIIITGNSQDVADIKNETIGYNFTLNSTNPKQTNTPAPIATTCPSDTYNNGKLTINSVEVPNGLGGTLKYKAIMTLQALSNPLVFTVDQTTPLQ